MSSFQLTLEPPSPIAFLRRLLRFCEMSSFPQLIGEFLTSICKLRSISAAPFHRRTLYTHYGAGDALAVCDFPHCNSPFRSLPHLTFRPCALSLMATGLLQN